MISSRLKRMPSIKAKLKRGVVRKLGEMQDFAGCRAVVHSIDEVNRLCEKYDKPTKKYARLPKATYDYIASPKDDGYRSRHMVVRWNDEPYAGILVEIQVRTQFMHAWSTAVEVVDTFIRSALKSGQQQEQWSRFFLLASWLIADMEGTPYPPGTPGSRGEIVAELRDIGAPLIDLLKSFTSASADVDTREDGPYFVVTVDTAQQATVIRPYRRRNFEEALAEYQRQEIALRLRPDSNAVLVNVNSVAGLRRAYPNYFADTKQLTAFIEREISE
ncbi:MAG: RelA/SpoT domain-containing protein [Actinomycetaceae bacterium]|nr:RelA/SpoT domain-containing protein [Actinomycetaceae bacterium]MDU0971233.1 RelA/SpoT domain-containing protein [Actinomycetaceae bacterium]